MTTFKVRNKSYLINSVFQNLIVNCNWYTEALTFKNTLAYKNQMQKMLFYTNEKLSNDVLFNITLLLELVQTVVMKL